MDRITQKAEELKQITQDSHDMILGILESLNSYNDELVKLIKEEK